MTVLVILASAIFAAWAFGRYVDKARQYLDASMVAWDRLYDATQQAMADDTMPHAAVGFGVASVMCSGCGCLTTRILFDWATGKIQGKKASGSPPTSLDGMTPQQKALFSTIVSNALLYDSLRVPFRGFVLRRLVFPWLETVASDPQAAPGKRQVAEIAASTRRAIAERPEGRRLLELAH